MVSSQPLADQGQLMKPHGELDLRVLHRVPVRGVWNLLPGQESCVVDRSPHFRVSVSKGAVLLVLARPGYRK